MVNPGRDEGNSLGQRKEPRREGRVLRGRDDDDQRDQDRDERFPADPVGDQPAGGEKKHRHAIGQPLGENDRRGDADRNAPVDS